MRITSNDDLLAQVHDPALNAQGVRDRSDRRDNAFAAMGADTVEISDAARDVLEAKMREYGAETPDELSSEQLADLKNTMAEAEGVTDADRTALAERASDSPPPKGAAAATGGKTERRGPPPKKDGAATSDEDEVEDLESEISDLEDEIETLRAKAATDEDSREELKSKQVELVLLESQLALLEQGAAVQGG